VTELIADLHLHSKYSRAVSPQMVIPGIAQWAKRKGIGLVAAPDWTHPLFLRELKEELREAGEGVYVWKGDSAGLPAGRQGPKFILVTEIASIFSQNGKGRRIHTLVFSPDFATADKICEKLRGRGANLFSDGRPITGIPVKDLAEMVFSVSANCLVVPSHLWTPWFGTYGDKGGFDSLKEAYGDLAENIYAIETGHSSDPAMNWRIEELDSRAILSFSDAHSPAKMSREATVFNLKSKIENLKFKDIANAIKNQQIAYTIEFYPEEGKYHFTGHRKCGVSQSPAQTKKLGETCPVCGRPLTVGVMHRVEELATRTAEEVKTKKVIIGNGVKGIGWGNRLPYVRLVPLMEILAESLGTGFSSKGVLDEYNKLTDAFSSEFNVLLQTPIAEIAKIGGERTAEGIEKVRGGKIVVEPGYDGVFGTVKIWPFDSQGLSQGKPVKEQLGLF